VNPLVPLWIPRRVRLLVLWFEDADDLAIRVPGKVAPRTSLGNHARVDVLLNGEPHAFDDAFKLVARHCRGRGRRHALGRDGAYALGGLEDGVVDLEAVVVVSVVAVAPAGAAATLEARRDLVGPALQAGVDGFEVDARGTATAAVRRSLLVVVVSSTVVEAGAGAGGGVSGGGHAGSRAGLLLGPDKCRVEGRMAVREVVVRVVANDFGLGEALIARRGRTPGARHRGWWWWWGEGLLVGWICRDEHVENFLGVCGIKNRFGVSPSSPSSVYVGGWMDGWVDQWTDERKWLPVTTTTTLTIDDTRGKSGARM
jgi:hypothetical protein